MNVGGVQRGSSTTALVDSDGMSGSSGLRSEAVVESVSQLFGMSPRELRHQVDSGRTMMSIAADKGISPMDLLKTIRAAMLLASSATRHDVTDSRTARAAGRIAHSVGSAAGPVASGHLDASL